MDHVYPPWPELHHIWLERRHMVKLFDTLCEWESQDLGDLRVSVTFMKDNKYFTKIRIQYDDLRNIELRESGNVKGCMHGIRFRNIFGTFTVSLTKMKEVILELIEKTGPDASTELEDEDELLLHEDEMEQFEYSHTTWCVWYHPVKLTLVVQTMTPSLHLRRRIDTEDPGDNSTSHSDGDQNGGNGDQDDGGGAHGASA